MLTLTTGALDAVSYLRLGKVFSSVITGNLALLGVATGLHDAMLALNAGLELAGYACGVLVGGTFAGTPERGQPAWPVRVTFTLVVEWGVLAAFSGEWLVTGGHPAGGSRLAVLLLGAAAMGMRSTAVHDLESGALARFRRDASMPVREALGRQWMAFVAARMLGDTRHDPF